MTRHPVLASVALAVLLLRCGGCGSGGTPIVYEAPVANDLAVETNVAALQVWLSVHDRAALELAPGWPWVITARVQHPAAFGHPDTAPLVLAGADGAAESALSLRLVDAAGAVVPVAFERVGEPLQGPVTVAPDNQLARLWRVPASETEGLSPGTYRLSLQLVSGAVPATRAEVLISLSATPDAGLHAGALSGIDHAMAGGEWAAAEAQVDSLLASSPDEVELLVRKALLREEANDSLAALDAYDAAIRAELARNPAAPEGGPRHLYYRRAALGEAVSP